MKPFVMQSRQTAYAEILRLGLIAIREAAYSANLKICEIESDHLHNLPDLMNEPNEARHHYYIQQERSLYLQRLQELADKDYALQRNDCYAAPWNVLLAVASEEL